MRRSYRDRLNLNLFECHEIPNVAVCSDIVCVECARLSLTSQFSRGRPFVHTRVKIIHTRHTLDTQSRTNHEENKNSDGAPGARWSCWWRAQRGAGQPSHVASLHPRPGVYTCTALRELNSISWCRLRGRPACAPSSLSLFVSAPARYSSNKRRSTLSRAASAGRTCERSKQATRSRSRGEPGCWRTSSSSACSEGGAAGQRA